MTDSPFSLLPIIFLGIIACVILYFGFRRINRESPCPAFTYQHSIDFFSAVEHLIAIIGVIATIISLSPLFLTFILGDGWLQIMLTTQIGILALGSIIIATYFSAFFIYCLLALIVIRWFTRIGRNPEVRISEKIISFAILISGVVAIFSLVWFLLTAWFLSLNAPISIAGLGVFAVIAGLTLVIVLAVFMDLNSLLPYPRIKTVFSFILVLFFCGTAGIVLFLAISGSTSLYMTASNYTDVETYSFTIDPVTMPDTRSVPRVVALNPDFSTYPLDDINVEYADCRWSANYGYFFTIRTDSMLTEKRSGEFEIRKCIQDPDYRVYWTYDLLDYAKNKPPVIVSMQVEDANKKHATDSLGKAPDYIIGSAHANFTWSGADEIAMHPQPVF